MSRKLLVIGLLFGCLLLGGRLVMAAEPATDDPPSRAQSSPASPVPPPRAQVPRTEFHFGAVKPEATVTYDFMVNNVGRGELEILSVTPG